jgi:hypothetical protein
MTFYIHTTPALFQFNLHMINRLPSTLLVKLLQARFQECRYLSMALQPFAGPWPLFHFLDFYKVGRTPWTGDQPVARPLPIHRTEQTQNKRTQTSMPQVEFEPTVPVFEWAKTVHALDRASTVIGPECR